MTIVKEKDKRIGLRMIYKQFEVPRELRYKYREIWDVLASAVAIVAAKKVKSKHNERQENPAKSEALATVTV
jgi:hypothetical protein